MKGDTQKDRTMLYISIDPGLTVGVYGALENKIFARDYPFD
jgi:hypothetical protein